MYRAHGDVLGKIVSPLSVLMVTPNKCADPRILAFFKLLTNDSQEYRESGAEKRPSVARCVAGRVAFHRLLADFYVEYISHTVLSISVHTRALQDQRALESCRRLVLNFGLQFNVSQIGQSMDTSSVKFRITCTMLTSSS